MECDRCGRTIEGGAMVSLGARRPFRNLCRICWGVETRSSNSRLITALNQMTRGQAPDLERTSPRAASSRSLEQHDDRGSSNERRRKVVERRGDPERPRWHS